MTNYKIEIAYDGRYYKGFNQLRGDKPEKSIQGKLQSVLSKLFKTDIELSGAVNTDAGVHALGQVANFKAPAIALDEADILDYINQYLPEDIVVKSVEKVDERFHSRLNAKKITYQYSLWKKNSKDILLFERHQCYKLNDILNVNNMQYAAGKLIGKHDFAVFTNRSKNKKTIKELYDVTVEETDNEIIINMTANNYLLNMERFIVGTLIQIGTGQKDAKCIELAFDELDKDQVGHKAMAHSLCLMSVSY